MNFDHSDFLAFFVQFVDGFLSSFSYGTHGNDDVFSFRITIVSEWSVVTSGDFADLSHVVGYDIRYVFVMSVSGFYTLEENVVIFIGTAGNRVGVRLHCVFLEFSKSFVVDQVFVFVDIEYFDLVNFMRSSESVKEVNEWRMSLDSSKVSYTCKVHNFLYGMAGKHWHAGLTDCVNVRVVAKDIQRTAGQRSGCYVKNNRKVFTYPFVNVRDH